MTKKKFLNIISRDKEDIVQKFLNLLKKTRAKYCVIGGLAVNAYVEPVVSLDLDIVIKAEDLEKVCRAAQAAGFKVNRFSHSINIATAKSDMRIQAQTDARYQEFLGRAQRKRILGYSMKVATLEDVIRGKIWAYSDETRRKSKRQKDLADILRIIESFPKLKAKLPPDLRRELT
ncbi:MAG: hypothetical protein QHH14_12370 [Clostridiales bacterium]|nr:hypothetical protein [Clostridiales bacterium]